MILHLRAYPTGKTKSASDYREETCQREPRDAA
jgi:hypothetical protein